MECCIIILIGEKRLNEWKEKRRKEDNDFFLWGGANKQAIDEMKREFLEDTRKFVNSWILTP